MTPREFQWEVDAAQKRFEDASDHQVALAWEIERVRVLSANAAHKHQAMPALQSLLHRRTTKRQSSREMRNVLQVLAETYGIPLKPVVH